MSAETRQTSSTVLSQDIAEDDFAALSGLMLDTLRQAASDGRPQAPASFSLEFTVTVLPAGRITAEAQVERATRTLVFVAAEARNESGARLCVASAVLKVIG